MLRSVKDLSGYRIRAADGYIGNVEECYFDDETWSVRYLVAQGGPLLPQEIVLLSPISLGGIDDEHRVIQTTLDLPVLRNSPPIRRGEPVSRRYEQLYYQYYGWPEYWGAAPHSDVGFNPSYLLNSELDREISGETPSDTHAPHLRSTRAMDGYLVRARDGEPGTVTDFLVGDDTWSVRFIVLGIRGEAPARETLISPHWPERIIWNEMTVVLDMPGEALRQAPAYERGTPVTDEYLGSLERHFGREEGMVPLSSGHGSEPRR